MLYDPVPARRCADCGEIYSLTFDHFYSQRVGKYRYVRCRTGYRESGKRWRKEHPEQAKAASTRWRRAHPEKNKEYKKRHRALHPGDNRKRRCSDEQREKMNTYGRRWRTANPEYGRSYAKRYRIEHLEQVKKAKKEYRETHKEVFRASGMRYYRAHKEKFMIADFRRRSREDALPTTLTPSDWQHALDHFNGCCAVCGRPPGLWHTIAADHWIPVSSPDCPGTVPSNIVPLCHGVDGCNNKKSNRDAREWLTAQFGQRKANQIADPIEDYLKSQEGL